MVPLLAALLATAPLAVQPAEAQMSARERATLVNGAVRMSPALQQGRFAVVVDVESNLLHFMRGREILWSAPVGTGMALRLETGDRGWDFSTPTGVYQVQYKEENPVWIAPDWFYIENGLPVPSTNDPRRRFPNVLGSAAVYIGRGLAIHGTDKPDLLGQRVSHGCIRLSNEHAQRLFHNVQAGTEVVIIGEVQEERQVVGPGVPPPGAGPASPAVQRLRDRAKAQRDRVLREIAALSNEELAEQLVDELGTRTTAREAAREAARWPDLASELLRRVHDDDEEAARVMLELASRVRGRAASSEFGTFLLDAFTRGAPTVSRVLAELEGRTRDRAAQAIVEAALASYHGPADAPLTPWPTRRVPREALAEAAQDGWDVLAAAERSYRESRRIGAVRGGG